MFTKHLAQIVKRKWLNKRVVAKASGWAGEVIKINEKNPSSPLKVKWDKTGTTSNENSMSVKVWKPE